jgi:hypothetical protein
MAETDENDPFERRLPDPFVGVRGDLPGIDIACMRHNAGYHPSFSWRRTRSRKIEINGFPEITGIGRIPHAGTGAVPNALFSRRLGGSIAGPA